MSPVVSQKSAETELAVTGKPFRRCLFLALVVSGGQECTGRGAGEGVSLVLFGKGNEVHSDHAS